MQVQDDDRRHKKAKEAPKKLPTVSLTLVSFAVTRKAYERITQRFAADYEARDGAGRALPAQLWRQRHAGEAITRHADDTLSHTHRLLNACIEMPCTNPQAY